MKKAEIGIHLIGLSALIPIIGFSVLLTVCKCLNGSDDTPLFAATSPAVSGMAVNPATVGAVHAGV
jgi:hypothetical protein